MKSPSTALAAIQRGPRDRRARKRGILLGLLIGGTVAVPTEATTVLLRDARERAIECVSITVYAESRGESLTGKAAVAWTVMNRVRQTGADPCTVVLSPEQFVALNLGPVQRYLRQIAAGQPYTPAYASTPADQAALEEARLVARVAYHGVGADPSNGALNFLAASWEHRVSPGHWSRSMAITARIGGHIFLRPPNAPQRQAQEKQAQGRTVAPRPPPNATAARRSPLDTKISELLGLDREAQ